MSVIEIKSLKGRLDKLETYLTESLDPAQKVNETDFIDKVIERMGLTGFDEKALLKRVDARVTSAVAAIPVFDEARLFRRVDERLERTREAAIYNDAPLLNKIAGLKVDIASVRASILPPFDSARITEVFESKISDLKDNIERAKYDDSGLRASLEAKLGAVKLSIPNEKTLQKRIDSIFDEKAFMKRVDERIVGLFKPEFDHESFAATIEEKLHTALAAHDDKLTKLDERIKSDIAATLTPVDVNVANRNVTVEPVETVDSETIQRLEKRLDELQAAIEKIKPIDRDAILKKLDDKLVILTNNIMSKVTQMIPVQSLVR